MQERIEDHDDLKDDVTTVGVEDESALAEQDLGSSEVCDKKSRPGFFQRLPRLPSWVNFNTGIALAGVGLGFWSVVQDYQGKRIDSRIEAERLLDEALDLIGGETGTTWVSERNESREELELARRNIDKALLLDGKNPRAFHRLALYYQATDRTALARENLEKAIELDPSHEARRAELVRLLESEGNLSEAEAVLRGAVEIDRSEPNLASLARYLDRYDQKEEARSLYEEAIEVSPHPYLYYELSWILVLQEQLEQAEEMLVKAVSGPSPSPQHFIRLAHVQELRFQYSDAERSYRAAVASNGAGPSHYVHLGAFLEEQARFEEAKAQYKRALKLDPSYGNAHLMLASNMSRLLELNGAEYHYRRAMESLESNSAPLGLERVLSYQGRHREAESIHETLINLSPDDANDYINYAAFLRRLGRLDDAEEVLVRASERCTEPDIAWNALGRYYEIQGRLKDAERAFEAALAANPSSLYNRYALARARDQRLQNGELKRFLETTVDSGTDRTWILSNLAEVYRKEGLLGKRAEVLQELATAEFGGCYYSMRLLESQSESGSIESLPDIRKLIVSRYRDDSSCYLHFGLFLAEIGELGQAESLLRVIVERHPDRMIYGLRLGQVLARKGYRTEAEAFFRKAIELSPKGTGPYYCLAELLDGHGRTAEAALIRDEAREVNDLLGVYGSEDRSCPPLRRAASPEHNLPS